LSIYLRIANRILGIIFLIKLSSYSFGFYRNGGGLFHLLAINALDNLIRLNSCRVSISGGATHGDVGANINKIAIIELTNN